MKLHIRILGPKIAKTVLLFDRSVAVANKYFPEAVVEISDNSNEFSEHSLLFLPILEVNGEAISRGKVFSEEELLDKFNSLLPENERAVAVKEKKKKPIRKSLFRWPAVLAAVALLFFLSRFLNTGTDDATSKQSFSIADSVNREFNYSQNGKGYSITFLEFGSTNCVECKKMELVLDSIRQEFPKVVNVVFVEVRNHQNDSLTDYFKVNLIPTQVLLDAKAQEFYRHVGYIPADSLSMIIHEDIESHE